MRRISERMTIHARASRNTATPAERTSWRLLAVYRPRFTRQLVAGPYIIDLACRTAKLAVELDGSQHIDQAGYDATRTRWLEAHGWTVLRPWNGDVLNKPEGAALHVLGRAAECLGGTHPQLLPSREGRKRKLPMLSSESHP